MKSDTFLAKCNKIFLHLLEQSPPPVSLSFQKFMHTFYPCADVQVLPDSIRKLTKQANHAQQFFITYLV